MSWGTTTTALCLGELQGYRARAVEFFERCCEQRTDPLIKLIQAINVRQNRICKLPDVSPSDTLAFTMNIVAAEPHLAYRFEIARHHRPRIVNVCVPSSGDSVNPPEFVIKGFVRSLAVSAPTQHHCRSGEDQLGSVARASVRVKGRSGEGGRHVAQSCKQAEQSPLQTCPGDAHMPEFLGDNPRKTEIKIVVIYHG